MPRSRIAAFPTAASRELWCYYGPMSLKKKIVLSFLLSAFIIALLSAFLYLNFVEIKNETVFLELADTIRRSGATSS